MDCGETELSVNPFMEEQTTLRTKVEGGMTSTIDVTCKSLRTNEKSQEICSVKNGYCFQIRALFKHHYDNHRLK